MIDILQSFAWFLRDLHVLAVSKYFLYVVKQKMLKKVQSIISCTFM